MRAGNCFWFCLRYHTVLTWQCQAPKRQRVPISMKVSMLKMLCKRFFRIPPERQRLVYQENEVGFQFVFQCICIHVGVERILCQTHSFGLMLVWKNAFRRIVSETVWPVCLYERKMFWCWPIRCSRCPKFWMTTTAHWRIMVLWMAAKSWFMMSKIAKSIGI